MQFKHLGNGTFVVEHKAQRIGWVTYTFSAVDSLRIEHVEVIPAYRGQGIAEKLVLEVVDFARAKELKIIPICSYARALFRRKGTVLDDVRA